MSRLAVAALVLCLNTLLLIALPLGSTLSASEGRARPNVILIMTDNHGAWTLGCYGNPEIRTPHIDALASEGTLFTRAFASNPVCSPTRATCLTGLMPSQHGVHSFLAGGRLQTGPEARCTLDTLTSLPEILSSQGYRCGLVGKWHLGGNMTPQEGLDANWITMPHGGTSTFYGAKVIQDSKQRVEPSYLTDFWTDHAVNFISRESESDKPFFLFLAYNGPYSLSRLLLREGKNRHAEFYRDKPMNSFPSEPTHPWQFSNRDYANNPISHRRVATEVSGVDDGVGTVMRTLKEKGIDENTLVIFLADQGWVGGHGGFYGMGDHTRPLTARDGMMQIPLIVRHPGGIPAGKQSSQMVANYDVMPTLLGYLGLADQMPDKPKSPGQDFAHLLRGSDAEVPRAIFYEYENLRCVRTEDMKYVHRHPNGPHELYDLTNDADEFHNLVDDPTRNADRLKLSEQLAGFFETYAEPKYDLYNGGTSQVRIHDGIDEEMAQLTSVEPPPLPKEFSAHDLQVPDGFTVELVAGPPLVTHPTLGCLDESGHLYICNNAGMNLTSQELETQLPNEIRRLSDGDGDGRFDSATVFADKMTFPMGGAWHDGSLYVASPPCIWKLTDTDGDGVADQRVAIVKGFGYNGNAASIHGCFFGPDGRLYWCDGFHGHEITDQAGELLSKREGSYIFSCLPDGSDVQLLAGGGMDNPVELDWTRSGDVLGTVNIMYHRPRQDCLVHWLHGGAYPHREKVKEELKVTGDFLGPAHRFGHVAVSGLTRYRSGVMDHRWRDNFFTTFFNHGKVVRLVMEPDGSTWSANQHEFLSSKSRDFHPTDVIEDADGSLLVVDTGGWFYRGCPTSQFAKPSLQGGIYRIRRSGMTPMVDPRGDRIDWSSKTPLELTRLLNDTRFVVREKAINECVRRGESIVSTLRSYVVRGDFRVRLNSLQALGRIGINAALSAEVTAGILPALKDTRPEIRQFACRVLPQTSDDVSPSVLAPLLRDASPAVRRTAAASLGKIGDADAVPMLLRALKQSVDRSEEHACIYALIEINRPDLLLDSISSAASVDDPKLARAALVAIDQSDKRLLLEEQVVTLLASTDPALQRAALEITRSHTEWKSGPKKLLLVYLKDEAKLTNSPEVTRNLIARLANDFDVAEALGDRIGATQRPEVKSLCLEAMATAADLKIHKSWLPIVRRQLLSTDLNDVILATDVIASSKTDQFDGELQSLADDRGRRAVVRLRALRLLNRQTKPLSDSMMQLVHEILDDPTSPSDAMAIAQWLPSARLLPAQLSGLTRHFESASPMLLRELIRIYTRARDAQLCDTFLTMLAKAPALKTLPENELSDVIKRFPTGSLPLANDLLEQLRSDRESKKAQLAGLLETLPKGDSIAGRGLFFSEKAKCSACHRIGDEGKSVGPDLTTIGANRSTSDLLESIVLPSASIVRDYGTFQVLTDDGKSIAGLLESETSQSLTIQQTTGDLVKLNRDEILSVSPSQVSMMPIGLDEVLTKQELADLISFLRSKK